jgi:hypothetical protein
VLVRVRVVEGFDGIGQSRSNYKRECKEKLTSDRGKNAREGIRSSESGDMASCSCHHLVSTSPHQGLAGLTGMEVITACTE